MGLPRNIIDTAKQVYRKVDDLKGSAWQGEQLQLQPPVSSLRVDKET